MANHTTAAQRYNKRMDKIFEQAKINTNNWGDGMRTPKNSIEMLINASKDMENERMAKHTKTQDIIILIQDKKEFWFYKNEVKSTNKLLELPNNKETWAKIYKAINCHDELVAALNMAKARILELHGEHDRNYSCDTLDTIDEAIIKASAK